MQVHIIQYRNAGDDEIETFGITITSHRWLKNIYKRVDPGSKKKLVMRSCSCQVDEIKSPAGLVKKGDRSGPLYWPKRGAPVESPGTMYTLYILEPSTRSKK